MEIDKEAVGILASLLGLLGLFAKGVTLKTRLEDGQDALNKRIDNMKASNKLRIREQEIRDEKQDANIKQIADDHSNMRVAVTQINGKLDTITTLIDERMPKKE